MDLLGDDSDPSVSDDDENDGKDEDQELPIEKASKELKQQQEEDDQLAEEELQLNVANKEKYDLDTENIALTGRFHSRTFSSELKM